MIDYSSVVTKFRFRENLFIFLSFLLIAVVFSLMVALVVDIFWDGLPRIRKEFFLSYPSRRASEAGILSAWVGTLLILSVGLPFAFIVGVLAGIYLEEYAKKNIITKIIEVNINNLAAVPSIVYGLLAVGIFAQVFGFGESIITGGLALGVLVLPIVIVTTRESVRAFPYTIREAAFSLGSTKFETLVHHILPYSFGGIITGFIMALTRAIGETAPLITVGALTFIAFLPPSPFKSDYPFISFEWLLSPFTALPIQMFNWVSRPQKDFHINAAGVGVVLVLLTIILITLMSIIRYRFRKKLVSI